MLEPLPGVEVIMTCPLKASTAVLTASMPTPRPEISVIFSLVLKPA